MGVAQTGRPMTGVIEKTVFAEMWECAGYVMNTKEGKA